MASRRHERGIAEAVGTCLVKVGALTTKATIHWTLQGLSLGMRSGRGAEAIDEKGVRAAGGGAVRVEAKDRRREANVGEVADLAAAAIGTHGNARPLGDAPHNLGQAEAQGLEQGAVHVAKGGGVREGAAAHMKEQRAQNLGGV